nr:Asp23/Gls24 family envelope stress response protein [Herbiconiux flava]
MARTVADTALGVSGVHRLGTPFGRAVDSVRRSAFGSGSNPGVVISQRDDGLAISVSLVVEYPANVTEVAETARTQIAHAVGQLHEHPIAVDVTITDVHGPFDATTSTGSPE